MLALPGSDDEAFKLSSLSSFIGLGLPFMLRSVAAMDDCLDKVELAGVPSPMVELFFRSLGTGSESWVFLSETFEAEIVLDRYFGVGGAVGERGVNPSGCESVKALKSTSASIK